MKNSSASVAAGHVAKIPGMAACLAIGLLTAAVFSPSARADSYERVEGTFRYGDAQEVLEIVNMERSNAGVESLVMTEELTDVAMMRAAETAVLFDHDRPNGLVFWSAFPQSWAYGENIAKGQTSPAEVMGSWMNSTGHRNNILNKAYTRIGIGCFYDGYYYYWVQAFATTDGDVDERTGEVQVTVDVSLDSELDTIVYGVESRTCKVTFYANGGSGGETRSVAKGKAVGTLPKATRKGYKFNGWYTKKSGGTKIKTTTKVKKNVTYYAQWTANKYKIKFNANGGKGTMKTQTATYGKKVTLRANAFKKSKYTFAGWAKKKNGKVVYKNKAKVKNLTTVNGKTVTLYAKWKKAKSSSVESANAAKSAAVIAAAVPTWAVGTFYGGGEDAFTTITVSKTGKVSGKVLFAEGKWTIVGKANGQRIDAVVADEEGNSTEVVLAIVKKEDGSCRIESEDGLIWAE